MKRVTFFILLFGVLFFIKSFSQTDCGIKLTNYDYSLNDAAFLDDNTIIVIGEDGLIMKSDDLGNSWRRINSGTSNNLRKIQFLNSKVGYIIGKYDTFLKTDNGGENWFKIPLNNPDYPYITNLHFLSPDTGYVVGEGGKIFKTNDGGRTWIYKNTWLSDLYSVFFVNDSIGFVCGSSNNLLKTTDFGKTWENIDMNDFGWNLTFMDIVFTSGQDGYLIEREGELLKTSDQGISWIKIADIPTDYATNIYFVDKNIGYVIGGWTSSTFYKTINSGANWERANYSNSGSFSGIALNKTGVKGIVVGDAAGYGSTSESGNIMLLTENDGDNWNTLSYLDGEMYFYDISFIEDSIGYLFGGAYQGSGCGFKTTNAGLTWQKLDFYSEYIVQDCYFVNRDTGFIGISTDSLYRTFDGGGSWSLIHGVKTSYHLGDKMHFFDGTKGLCIDDNAILKTLNSGNSWDTVAILNSGWLNDINFFNNSLGIAVGYNVGMITKDAGNTWKQIESLPKYYFKTCYFISNNNIIVAGNSGIMYKSEDGGETWSKITTNIYKDIIDLHVYNDSVIIAFTHIEIYHSYDFGLTWSQTLQAPEKVQKYADLDNGNGFFVGERGLIRKFDHNIPPNIPNYIIGDTLVIKDSIYNYHVLSSYGERINWNIEDGNILKVRLIRKF